MSKSIAQVELKEFLYSQTLVSSIQRPYGVVNPPDSKKLRDTLREILRLHRFDVVTWLLENGAQIPSVLLVDGAHPAVGAQAPDRPVEDKPQNLEP